jgi:NAD(P)-dependent dehydrogenase (short-subunit alcohol dehydrogenase family)
MNSGFNPLQAFSLQGRTAVVTGGGNGIGKAVAIGLARSGAHVVVMDHEFSSAQSVVSEIVKEGLSASAICVDVKDEAQVDQAMKQAYEQHQRLDILINNAGIAIRKPSIELALADWNRVLEVNLTGVFLCARSAARFMITQGSGAIVNTASIMGLSGGGLYPNISYQSTKGAIVNLTRALAVEWAPHQIRVNAIAPTWVETDFIKSLMAQPDLIEKIKGITPLGRLAKPEDIVGAVVFLCSPCSSMVTGHTLAVDGGFLAQ